MAGELPPWHNHSQQQYYPPGSYYDQQNYGQYQYTNEDYNQSYYNNYQGYSSAPSAASTSYVDAAQGGFPYSSAPPPAHQTWAAQGQGLRAAQPLRGNVFDQHQHQHLQQQQQRQSLLGSTSTTKKLKKGKGKGSSGAVVSSKSWPPSLRKFVEKVFHECRSSADREKAQEYLKETIAQANESGVLWTHDWEHEKCPSFTPSDTTLTCPICMETFVPSKQDVTYLNKLRKRAGKTMVKPPRKWEDAVGGFPIKAYSPEAVAGMWALHFGGMRWEDWVHEQCLDTLAEKAEEFQKASGRQYPEILQHKWKELQKWARHVNELNGKEKLMLESRHAAAASNRGTITNGSLSQPLSKKQKRRHQQQLISSAGEGSGADAEEDLRKRLRQGRFGSDSLQQINYINKEKKEQRLKTKKTEKVRRQQQMEEAGLEANWDQFVVKGTCKKLEKSYFRLTSAPDPKTVRPQAILEKALYLVCEKVKSGKENYFYAQDQLKSIRQDCTVQHIKNDFTVKIYETHARMAIEYGELSDYNQCQAQLITLYAENLTGCESEFLAYRILYQTFALMTGNFGELLKSLKLSCQAEHAKSQAVVNALRIRDALKTNNFIKLFRLYEETPNLGKNLIDLFVDKQKFKFLNIICRNFKPHISLAYVAKGLGYFKGSLNKEEWVSRQKKCAQWCIKHGASFLDADSGKALSNRALKKISVEDFQTKARVLLNTKESMSKLSVPEDTTKVAHGDANLALDDFLKAFK